MVAVEQRACSFPRSPTGRRDRVGCDPAEPRRQNLAQDRQLVRLAAIDLFLSQIDTRLARFEERQNNVLKTLDENAKRLQAINEGLQMHIRQWPSGANGK